MTRPRPPTPGGVTSPFSRWAPPERFAFGEGELKPLRAGEALPWRLVGNGT